nr:hypothetical protein B0A51_09179 [Rachicladosporium sp. CCFEE 5018]
MDPFEKSSTVDPEVRAYVYSLVSALGGRSTLDASYAIGDDALAVLKDLTRWIRLYDEKTDRHDVKRCLAEANLVKGDLLEILAQWPEGSESKYKSKLALGVLELLVPLTWPLDGLGEEREKSGEFHKHVPFLQLAQVGYKRAVLHCDATSILRTVVRIGLPAMATTRRERSKRDEGIIRLVLYLFRNLAMIVQPQHLPSQGDENDVTRSATIDAFHAQDILTLLLTVGSGAGDEFQDYGSVMLEILFHLLKGVDAKKLFMKKEQVASTDTQYLKETLSKERAMLDSYNKFAPTRHNRFGTMVWVKRDDTKYSTVTGQHSITNESQTLHQMDKTKKWNKPKYLGKLPQEFNEQSDFGMTVELTDTARKHLQSFVEDFLDSSFNPLFSCLRKAIEREDVGSENVRQYFYLVSWFLNAEAARRDATHRENGSHADRPTQTEENTYAYIAAVLDQETFVLMNRNMQRAFDDKDWRMLQTTLLAFTQILLTVQSMAASKDEEDQEIAENIQNRIFYEEGTHDRIVQILRGYTHQGIAYLDVITECTHVFVRMLERYAKTNVDMQVRSKRRSRKKQQVQGPAGENPAVDAEQAEEDTRDAQRTVSERSFDFARFSAKFTTQKSVDTFIALLHFHAELSSTQLKRCHRFFYRLAFKADLAILLFRVDILLLFHRLIKGPDGLDPKGEGFHDWETLVSQVFRKCVKWICKEGQAESWRKMCMIEMLFSKVGNTVFYLHNGFDRVTEKRAPRPPAELDFKACVTEEQKIAVAVAVMLEHNKADLIAFVRGELTRAIEERSAWESSVPSLAAQIDSDTPAPLSTAPCIFLSLTDPERKASCFKDKHLRLLLLVVGYQRLGSTDDVDAAWLLPSELSSQTLQNRLERIQKAGFDPPTFEDGKSAGEMIKAKGSYTSRSAAVNTFDSDSAASDTEPALDAEGNALFPPNERSKRANDADDAAPKKRRRLRRAADNSGDEDVDPEAEARKAAARAKAQKERDAKIKSRLRVTASDDESDEGRDAVFFAKEEERRKKTRGVIARVIVKETGAATTETSKSKGKGARKGKRKRLAKSSVASDQESDAKVASGDVSAGSIAPDRRRREVLEISSAKSSESDSDESTPVSSPPATSGPKRQKPSDKPVSVAGDLESSATDDDVEMGDDAPLANGAVVVEDMEDGVSPVKQPMPARRTRAGFVVDDSSDAD